MMQNEEIDLLDENNQGILQREIEKRLNQENNEDNELDNSVNINVDNT